MPLVKIRVEAGSEDTGIKQDANQAQKALTEQEKARQASMSLFTHAMQSEVKKIINYSVANIGNLTGDSIRQQNVQRTMGYIQDIATIALGYKSSGAVGATIAIAGITLSKGLEVASYFIEQRHNDIEREYLLERSGNATLNGGRGTEN